MTLTEEQRGTVGFDLEKNRAAIDSAINSLLCEGWDNEASTVRRLVAEIERLRAENEEALESLTAAYLLGRHEKAHEQAARPKEGKIDSSEHVTEPTKMIGFDLERARVEVDTASARRFSESREQARIFCAEEILPDALDEIERLRPFEIAARDLDSDLTKIAGERDDQAARIKELEDALAEERAKYNLSWKDCAYRAPDTYCEKTHNYCTSEDCPLLDEQKTEARRQLRAEGKIGPDAKPRVWQITDERKATLSASLKVLERLKKNNTDTDHSYLDRGITVLRAMLEAGL